MTSTDQSEFKTSHEEEPISPERKKERKNPIYNIYNISKDQLSILSNQRGSQQALYCSSDLWHLFLQAARIKGQNGSRATRIFMVDYIFNASKEPMTDCEVDVDEEPAYVAKCLYCSSQATIAARSWNGRYLICEPCFHKNKTRFQSWEQLP